MEILIVEDDYISRNMLSKVLSGMGHRVVEAENGRIAWELLQQRPIRVVITDWMMPEMDGVQLCRNIRETPLDRYIYVVILTAKDRKSDLVEVFQAGADDYIPKPFDPEELKARVLTGLRVTDLEERHRRMQSNLIESRNKLRIVIDSLQEQIVAVDKDYTIISANKSFCDYFDVDPEDIIGRNCLLQGNELRDFCVSKFKSLVDNVFETGSAEHTLHTHQNEGGATVYLQIACLPVRDETGNVMQVLVVSNNVTEIRRKSEEIKALNERMMETTTQLEAKNKRLEATLARLEETQAQMMHSEKMASIGQLAAGVAHEINNPTGFVSSNLKTLGDYQQDMSGLIEKYQHIIRSIETSNSADQIDPAIKEAVSEARYYEQDIDINYILGDIDELIDDCKEGTERIKKIVTDLKDFAHPGEDKLKSVDINHGLSPTLNVVNNEIKYKAVVETEYGDIPTVHAYPQQLNQVFMNILVNAAQAIDSNGRITIKTQAKNGHVEVLISDTGCGIAKEHLSRIFDPFFTTKEVGKGTGLGMNIAYNIIKKHNGAIDVQSEVGKGTTFKISLPVES